MTQTTYGAWADRVRRVPGMLDALGVCMAITGSSYLLTLTLHAVFPFRPFALRFSSVGVCSSFFFFVFLLFVLSIIYFSQVPQGARVGTFAWNTIKHLELWFGVPCSR